MQTFIENFSYFGVALVIFGGGIGLPIPEDIPLLFGGYLCGRGYAELWIMLPFTFFVVVGSDCMVYWLGHHFGWRITQMRWFRKFLSPKRMAKAEALYHRHGGKTLFVARFLPGLRTPLFFSAGVFKIPFWKMLVYDGAAALVSAPVFVLLGWYFSNRIHSLIAQIDAAKPWVILGVVLGVAAMIGVKLLIARWMDRPAGRIEPAKAHDRKSKAHQPAA